MKMNLVGWSFISVIFATVFQFCTAAFALQANLKDSDKELCGIVEYGVLNAEAWQKGEFRSSVEQTLDKVKMGANGELSGVLVETRLTRRSAFDIERQKYAIFEFQIRRIIDFNDKSSDEKLEIVRGSWRAGCIDYLEKTIYLNDSSEGYRTAQFKGTLSEAISSIGFQDYRSCWSLNGYRLQSLVEEKRRAAFIRQGLGVASVTEKNGNIVIKQNGVSNLPGVDGPFLRFVFDKKTSMRTLTESFFRSRDGGNLEKKISPTSKRVEWEELDGIFVPKLIIASKPLKYRMGQAKVMGLGDETIELDWRSLNVDDLNPKLFDGSFVRDFEDKMGTILPGAGKH
jgi:hypothetical protein